MPCSVNHEVLLRNHPMVTICPDCRNPLDDVVIDLTDLTSLPSTPVKVERRSHAMPAGRSRSHPPAVVAPGAAIAQSTIEKMDNAHKLAKENRTESLAKEEAPLADDIMQVGVNIYFAEEYIEQMGNFQVSRLEKVRKCKALALRPAPLLTVFDNQEHLISYIKAHWRVPPQYARESYCYLVGPVSSGNGATVVDLAMAPEEPVRLADIRPMMLDGPGSKEKFNLNLFFPRRVDTSPDDVDSGNAATSAGRKKRSRKSSPQNEDNKGRSGSKVKVETKTEVKPKVKTEVKTEPNSTATNTVGGGGSRSNSATRPLARRGGRYGNLPPPLQTRRAARNTSVPVDEEERQPTEANDEEEEDDDNLFPPIENLLAQRNADAQ